MAQLANTTLDQYFLALDALHEVEVTALAEAHATDPSPLVSRFLSSVETVQSRVRINEPFYETMRKDLSGCCPPAEQIRSTIEFAGCLSEKSLWSVDGDDALAFRYVDREISPTRTLDRQARHSRRSLDLLLANSRDQLPVLAELKIRSDKPAYYALVQLLMLAAEFQSDPQRDRLTAHRGAEGLRWPREGPFFDLYLVAFEAPSVGKYRARQLDATAKISEGLILRSQLARHVRRVVYLDAKATDGEITFQKRFAFG